MKRFFPLKSLSRTVHNDHEDEDEDDQDRRLRGVGGEGNDVVASLLTVWRKSLLINCNGFTVIGSNGDLIYRVDNYIGRPEEITLMDGHGKSVLTMRRCMKLGVVVESWFVYEGEYLSSSTGPKRPIFWIRKNINILQITSSNNNKKHKVVAQIYDGVSHNNNNNKRSRRRALYAVEGSYTHRCCRVLEGRSNKVVAETRRKEETVGGVSYGVEVFQLIVHPGFKPAFAMAFLLILDQMFS